MVRLEERHAAGGAPVADTVLYELADNGVATITLNRPEAMNSLTAQTKVALREALERAAADPAARAVVLTGAGRAFCAGQASFLMAFASVGLAPDSGASWTLQRLVGRAAATELLLLAEPVRAPRAL